MTGKLAAFAPHAKIVHADIDPAEIGKNRPPGRRDRRRPQADAGRSGRGAVAAEIAADGPPDTSAWLATLDGWKRQFPLRYTQDRDGPLKPQYVVERLSALTGGDAIVVAGVGQHQMHAAQHYSFTKPRSWINSGGARHHGLRGARRHGRPGGPARRAGGRDRRRRLLPDDRPGAGHLRDRAPADQGADLQQRLPGHGAPVAGAVLRGALLRGRAGHSHPRLREAGRGLRLLRAALRARPTRSTRCSTRRWPRPTCRPWWTSGCTTARACSRWCPRACRTTRSCSAPSSARRSSARPRAASCGRKPASKNREVGAMSTHTLSVLVENKPGVLAHVAGMFSRRAFNISSLAVGTTEDERVSRMTIVVDGAETPIEQVITQLDKLVRVLKVVELHEGAAVERELALIKVRIDPALRGELLEVAGVFHAKVVDMSPATIILEATSSPGKLDSLLANLERYGTCELVRTGRIAMSRGSRTITDRGLSAAPDPAAQCQPTGRPPRPSDRPDRPGSWPRANTKGRTFHGHCLLRHRRGPRAHPGPQGRRPRLRLPGARARAEPARLGLRGPRGPPRGLEVPAARRGRGPDGHHARRRLRLGGRDHGAHAGHRAAPALRRGDRAQPAARRRAVLRARLQHPLRLRHPAARGRRRDGRAQGPRAPGAAPVRGRPGHPGARSGGAGRHRQGLGPGPLLRLRDRRHQGRGAGHHVPGGDRERPVR